MKILITGASSGIGLELAKIYYKRRNKLYLVSRNVEALENRFPRAEVIQMDLSVPKNCVELHKMVDDVDILINNAGFGVWGDFWKTDLNNELNMIRLNVDSVHILTKLYVRSMIKNYGGTVMNVSSLAAYSHGPLMAAYYASKAYVYKLSTAIDYELKQRNKNVRVLCLCPGPVNTGFNKRAGVSFAMRALSPRYVARCVVKSIENGKRITIPGIEGKVCAFLSRLVPVEVLLRVGYFVQSGKDQKDKKPAVNTVSNQKKKTENKDIARRRRNKNAKTANTARSRSAAKNPSTKKSSAKNLSTKNAPSRRTSATRNVKKRR